MSSNSISLALERFYSSHPGYKNTIDDTGLEWTDYETRRVLTPINSLDSVSVAEPPELPMRPFEFMAADLKPFGSSKGSYFTRMIRNTFRMRAPWFQTLGKFLSKNPSLLRQIELRWFVIRDYPDSFYRDTWDFLLEKELTTSYREENKTESSRIYHEYCTYMSSRGLFDWEKSRNWQRPGSFTEDLGVRGWFESNLDTSLPSRWVCSPDEYRSEDHIDYIY